MVTISSLSPTFSLENYKAQNWHYLYVWKYLLIVALKWKENEISTFSKTKMNWIFLKNNNNIYIFTLKSKPYFFPHPSIVNDTFLSCYKPSTSESRNLMVTTTEKYGQI